MKPTITAQHGAEPQTWFYVRVVNLSGLLFPCEVSQNHSLLLVPLNPCQAVHQARKEITGDYKHSASLGNLMSEQAKTSLEVQFTPAESEMKICGLLLAGMPRCFESETKMIKQR